MRIHVITTPYYGANCVVLVPEGGREALVVDPSAGVRDQIRAALAAEQAHVGAVLATHGHPDHVWDCAEVASWTEDGHEVPVWIPGPDAYRMDNPQEYIPMSPAGMELDAWRRPSDLRECPADSMEYVPNVWLRMVPAPGHTEGSAVFLGHCDIQVVLNGVEALDSGMPVPWALSADVIFSGSVGRTDLPGGDEIQMRHTLRTLTNVLDPATILFPGHGPATTLQTEIDSNPYIARARTMG